MIPLVLFVIAGLLTWAALWLEHHGYGRDETKRRQRLGRDLRRAR